MGVLHGWMYGNREQQRAEGVGDALILHPCISDTAKRRRSSSPDSDLFSVARGGRIRARRDVGKGDTDRGMKASGPKRSQARVNEEGRANMNLISLPCLVKT